jgi:hypothetical protein
VNQNDCALTQQSPEAPLLLLETIPGLRFRSRLKNQDRANALDHFRNLVEAHATDTLDTSIIQDILGLEGYSLRYEHCLRIIPENQLSNIEWDKPLGRGENGVVYAATWHRPNAVLATMKTHDRTMPVVLKDIFPRKMQKQDPMKKMLKEVRTKSPFPTLLLMLHSSMQPLRVLVVR